MKRSREDYDRLIAELETDMADLDSYAKLTMIRDGLSDED